MKLTNHKKIYFASDQHFGAPTHQKSLIREKKFVRWLDKVKEDAEAIFLLGDLFDFWFEYKTVVPKGFIRVLGKLAEITDSGIPVYFFTVSKWFFRWLHPDLGMRLGHYLSTKNKLISGDEDVIFLGEENEWLVQYAKKQLETKPIDYFIFGHRHLPMNIVLNKTSSYVNLGEWISHFTYAVFDGEQLQLTKFEE